MPPIKTSTDSLTGLFPAEIAERIEAPLMRGRQLFQWLHKKRVFDIDAMTDMSKTDRARIGERHFLTALTPALRQESRKTGAQKALFELADGETIESVLLAQGSRITLCLSSQAGCALGCTFCATGQAGFRRDLSPAEITEQALRLLEGVEYSADSTPNIV